jgi:hypothetical protein
MFSEQDSQSSLISLNHYEYGLAQALKAGVSLSIARADALRRIPEGWTEEIAFTIPVDAFSLSTWAVLNREIIGPNLNPEQAAERLFQLRRAREAEVAGSLETVSPALTTPRRHRPPTPSDLPDERASRWRERCRHAPPHEPLASGT